MLLQMCYIDDSYSYIWAKFNWLTWRISFFFTLCHFFISDFEVSLLLSPIGVEYSDEAMLKAVRILSNWTAFLSNAEAYVRGQLRCHPINEPYLREW